MLRKPKRFLTESLLTKPAVRQYCAHISIHSLQAALLVGVVYPPHKQHCHLRNNASSRQYPRDGSGGRGCGVGERASIKGIFDSMTTWSTRELPAGRGASESSPLLLPPPPAPPPPRPWSFPVSARAVLYLLIARRQEHGGGIESAHSVVYHIRRRSDESKPRAQVG